MRIEADCRKIKANTEAVVALCAPWGIEVVGVSKCVCGEPDIARAMLAGGCVMIGESRLDNIRRLRQAGVDCDIMLLRLPALSEIDEVVARTQVSLNSEELVVRALSASAVRQGIAHRVLVVVEAGDRREGVMPHEAAGLCRLVLDLPGLELEGVAVCLNCLCGVLPTRENQERFATLALEIEGKLGLRLRTVSGGHTGNLHLVMEGAVPERFTQLRVGEGILFGTDMTTGAALPVPHTDTFTAFAEVIELKDKPSAPDGTVGIDAFHRRRQWPDLGVRRRAICAMGETDLSVSFLTPTHPGVSIVSASSDHTVLDVTDAEPPVQLGDELRFAAAYTAVAYGWTNAATAHTVV